MAKAPAKTTKKKSFKKKEKRVVHVGVVHVQATFNNTIVTITDTAGNVISWQSAGTVGFKGSRAIFADAYANSLAGATSCCVTVTRSHGQDCHCGFDEGRSIMGERFLDAVIRTSCFAQGRATFS